VSISLRASVIGTFILFVASLCLVGGLAITSSVRAVQQVTSFQEKALVPVVGISSLSGYVDQERDLLSQDAADMLPFQRRAIVDELSALDASIVSTASRVLLPGTDAAWKVAWERYIASRSSIIRLLLGQRQRPVRGAARDRVSNQLDIVLDVFQRQAGAHLYQGQRLYVSSVSGDWAMIRVTVVSVGLALFLALVLATLTVRRLTAGLKNLVGTAQALTAGRFLTRAATTGRDELTVIARAFNHMTDALLHLERTALTDPLTGLGNHRAFHEEFRRELARAARHGHPLSLALIDVDEFKLVNDRHGHAHGDSVLREFAAFLHQTRVEDRHFRVGGDEFAVLLPYSTALEAKAVLERLRSTIETNMPGVTICAGLANLDENTNDADTLREQADAALYESKRSGRNTVVLFESIRDQATIVSPAKMEAVRQLLSQRHVDVAFQPIWDLEKGVVYGYEALMRPPPDSGLSGPQEAFDIAEKLRRAPELDEICLNAILARAHELPRNAVLFINLSPRSLDHEAMRSSSLLSSVAVAGLSPSQIVFEVTERSVTNVNTVVREVKRLRSLGFRIALDDVGAGNAGLEMLRQVTVDFVKIDRSVISEALVDESAAAVLSGIVAFARRAHTFVIAEGIETLAMLDEIQQTSEGGVHAVQGFLFGRPSEAIVQAAPGIVLSLVDLKRKERLEVSVHPAERDSA
jgi:diguanylate cyclase (GGDEF)-like protein